MKAILVNYNYDPIWLKDYDFEVTIYDRSDDGVERDLQKYGQVIKTENTGNVDYDKLNYLLDNFDNLPEVFLWGKSNLFKFISKEEFDLVKDNTTFTPLLKKDHKTYSDRLGIVCYYAGGMYHERNDSWYLHAHPAKFHSYGEFATYLHLPNPHPAYLAFPPGGNFILTRETVRKFSREIYQNMADLLPYAREPGEAHMCERSYYNLWR